MQQKAKGTCIKASSDFANAWMLNNCIKGHFINLKVPSTNQVLAEWSSCSCCLVANMICLSPWWKRSSRRKSSGMLSICNSKSLAVGSLGLSFCLWRLTFLIMWSMFGKASTWAGSISFRICFLMIWEAEANGCFAASSLALEIAIAACLAPIFGKWLCVFWGFR